VPFLFGEKLRRTRHLKGFTQVELAHRVGLASHGHITNLETSRDVPSLELAIRVARILGVTTDYLLRDMIPVEDVPAGSDLPEGWTALTYLAALHPELQWGHSVLCQSFRNPALLAKMVATLQFLSGEGA
jgi:transcriptional regulator with XRE-family HTH domain